MRVFTRQPWADHMRTLQFYQGEHIFVSAPTGAGKTTLVRPLLDKRSHVVCFFTKLKDPTIAREYKGFKRFKEWPKQGFRQDEKHVMIWPSPEKTLRGTVVKHRQVFREAFDRVARDGGWTVYIDEMLYLTNPTYGGMSSEVGMLHYYGRSAGISAITCAQRPFNVPRVVLSSATHAYFARTYDAGDQKRLSELGSIDPREIVYNMKSSIEGRHDFLYLNPQGDMPSRVVNTRK